MASPPRAGRPRRYGIGRGARSRRAATSDRESRLARGASGSPTTKRCSPLGAMTRSERPSGDQDAEIALPCSSGIWRGSPPPSGRIHGWDRSLRSERKRSSLPLGEKVGMTSFASAKVSCSGRPPRSGTRQRRLTYLSPSIVRREYATHSPSGETDACCRRAWRRRSRGRKGRRAGLTAQSWTPSGSPATVPVDPNPFNSVQRGRKGVRCTRTPPPASQTRPEH